MNGRPVRCGIALALGGAAAGLLIPSLRTIAESSAAGSGLAGAFVAAHVAGGALGAIATPAAVRRLGSARLLAVSAFAACALLSAAMAACSTAAVLAALRFLDGICHLAAITTLLSCGSTGDPSARSRRAIRLGMSLVLGVAAGLGAGGAVAVVGPSGVLLGVAALSIAAGAVAFDALAQAAAPGPARDQPVERSPGNQPIGYLVPAALALAERLSFGVLTVAVPFSVRAGRAGALLGSFMALATIGLPLARRAGGRWGPRKLARRAAAALAIVLLGTAAPATLHTALAIPWAITGGLAAAGVYAASLMLVAGHAETDGRLRGMGAIQAAGSAGHATGAAIAGCMVAWIPPSMAIATLGGAIVGGALAIAIVADRRDRARPPRYRGPGITSTLPPAPLHIQQNAAASSHGGPVRPAGQTPYLMDASASFRSDGSRDR